MLLSLKLLVKLLWETGHYEHKFSSCSLLVVDNLPSKVFALVFRRTDFGRLRKNVRDL